MDKNIISVDKEDGSSELMEVISTFKLESTGKDCMIYKSVESGDYFAASYEGEGDYGNFNTDFSDEEIEELNKVFDALVNGGEEDA